MDIDDIRRRFFDGKFRASSHADEELGKARLTIRDLREAGSRGELIREETWHPEGTTYLIRGFTSTGRRVFVVVGFTEDDCMIVVTAYERSEKRRHTR